MSIRCGWRIYPSPASLESINPWHPVTHLSRWLVEVVNESYARTDNECHKNKRAMSYCYILGICQSGAAGGYTLGCLLAFCRSLSGILPVCHVFCYRRNVHYRSCHGQTACNLYKAAVMTPRSVYWTIRLHLSEVSNGDYLVVTWYLCSRYKKQEITSCPTPCMTLRCSAT